jgi:protocatechuate 3,4-dioxygenase beta subunit
VLTPAQTAGPFYFDPELLRRDITEGYPGAPLTLRLQVVDAGSCAPIRDAVVDVWHADAAGRYSGYPNQLGGVDTRGRTFLRGLQVTDAGGAAEFATIYPGWYPGRTTHIHFKVHVDDQTYLTSQLYFDDAVTAAVYAGGVYAARGQKDTSNARDGILDDDLPALLAAAAGEGDGTRAELVVGIDLPQPATPTPIATGAPTDCEGDCSGDGAVTVDELVQGVTQSLDGADAAACTAFDRDGDRRVTVSELVAAVRRALDGCA